MLGTHYSVIETTTGISAAGEQHFGFDVLRVAAVYEFENAATIKDWLREIDVRVDWKNLFDPEGTYFSRASPDPDFPGAQRDVQDAPRTSGPDGRYEGRVKLEIPAPP